MRRLIIIIGLLLVATGCQNYNELNDLAIIKSIGLEKSDEGFTLYAAIIEEVTKDNTPTIKVVEASNESIEEVFDDIKLLINKEIYLSHIDLIILNENLKNDDYELIINYFLNNNEFRNDFLAIFSNEIKLVLEKSKYDEIEEIITTNKDSKDVINITFEEIIKGFLDERTFKASHITYDEEIKFVDNILYNNNQTERIKNEK